MGDHFTSPLGEASACESLLNGTGLILSVASLGQKLFESKMKMIRKYGSIYANEVGGFCPCLSENDKIVDEVITEDFQYPKYTKDMIKIIRWRNGKHYYAKIGDIDVKDSNNNQKWNTYDMAYTVAKNILKTLN